MNLILLQNGYPPAIIHKRQRENYIKSLEHAQLGGERLNFDKLIIKAVDKSLDIYLKAVKGEDEPMPLRKTDLLKIGTLAKRTGQSVSTLRYWTQQGLLTPTSKTDTGYVLYTHQHIEQIKQILALKKERYTLAEIKIALDVNRQT